MQCLKQTKRTAKTLNRDVFPAFCRPIMVTSISVALHSRIRACLRYALLSGAAGEVLQATGGEAQLRRTGGNTIDNGWPRAVDNRMF